MKVIFVGTSGVHHPLVAAHMYCEKKKDIKLGQIKGFCDSFLEKTAKPLLINKDDSGQEVYSLGLGENIEIGCKALNEFIRIIDKNNENDIRIIVIRSKWEQLFVKLNSLPKHIGGEYVNLFLSKKLLEKQMNEIRKQVEEVSETSP